MAVRFAVGAHGTQNKKTTHPPDGPLHPQTGHGFTAHHFPLFPGKNIAPAPVYTHRPTFSVGLTASAVRRRSRRPPGSFRCCERNMKPC